MSIVVCSVDFFQIFFFFLVLAWLQRGSALSFYTRTKSVLTAYSLFYAPCFVRVWRLVDVVRGVVDDEVRIALDVGAIWSDLTRAALPALEATLLVARLRMSSYHTPVWSTDVRVYESGG